MKFFLFPFSILSHALEIHVSPFQKQLCSPIYNFIKFSFYFFNYYFILLSTLFKVKLFFNFFPVYITPFDFYIQFVSSTFDCSFSMFYKLFLINFFFSIFFPCLLLHFIAFVFLFNFDPHFLILFSYHFLDFFLSLNILFYFVFLSDFGSHSFNYIYF